MADWENTMHEIAGCLSHDQNACVYCSHRDHGEDLVGCMEELLSDAYALLIEKEEKIRSLEQTIEDICCGGN